MSWHMSSSARFSLCIIASIASEKRIASRESSSSRSIAARSRLRRTSHGGSGWGGSRSSFAKLHETYAHDSKP